MILFEKDETIDLPEPKCAWKNHFSYPLVCITNEHFATRAFFYSVLERNLGRKENLAGMIEFNLKQKILGAGSPMRQSLSTDVPIKFFVHVDCWSDENHAIKTVTVQLRGSLEKNSVTTWYNWRFSMASSAPG